MSVPLDPIPEPAPTAWIRLRDVATQGMPGPADLDAYGILRGPIEDVDLLAAQMAGFVAMVRGRAVLVER